MNIGWGHEYRYLTQFAVHILEFVHLFDDYHFAVHRRKNLCFLRAFGPAAGIAEKSGDKYVSRNGDTQNEKKHRLRLHYLERDDIYRRHQRK